MSTKITSLTKLENSASEKTQITSTPCFDKNKAYRCLHCTLSVDDKPIGCPVACIERIEYAETKHVERTFHYEYQTFGVFCSYNCAKAYAIDHVHNPLFRKSCVYITSMYCFEKYGQPNSDVVIYPAPSPLLLACYGGHMTERQYKDELGKNLYVSKGYTGMFPLTFMYQKT